MSRRDYSEFEWARERIKNLKMCCQVLRSQLDNFEGDLGLCEEDVTHDEAGTRSASASRALLDAHPTVPPPPPPPVYPDVDEVSEWVADVLPMVVQRANLQQKHDFAPSCWKGLTCVCEHCNAIYDSLLYAAKGVGNGRKIQTYLNDRGWEQVIAILR
jgi:hypothetical protein